LPRYAVVPFGVDLWITRGTPQTIYGRVAGVVGARTITFEWYTGYYDTELPSDSEVQFSAQFYEASPGTVLFTYYGVSAHGDIAVVGLQGNTGESFQPRGDREGIG